MLGLLSLWVIPGLRVAAEAQEAHLETSWAARPLQLPVLEHAAPSLADLEVSEQAPQLEDPDWEPPARPMPADYTAPIALAAVRAFRPLPPAPKPAKPAKRVEPVKVTARIQAPRPKAKRKRNRAKPTPPRVHTRSPVLRAPQVQRRPRVSWPSRCRRRNHQGDTRLLLKVSRKGRVKNAKVVHSAGCKHLDEAARKAGLEYRFQPGTRDGRATAWLVTVEIRFGPSS